MEIPLLLKSVEKELNGLAHLSADSCIYRVPENLRRTKPEEYSPILVSIGPFHHGDPKLKLMEDQKRRYLRALRDGPSKMNLNRYIGLIKSHENEIRGYYAEDIQYRSDEFIKMVLLDSAFIIEAFLIFHKVHKAKQTDKVFSRPNLINPVVRDMRLLENQLPFFILEKLYDIVIPPNGQHKDFKAMTYEFFNFKPRTPTPDIKHFVDLLRTCYLPLKPRARETEVQIAGADSVSIKCGSGGQASIAELQVAGVECKRNANSHGTIGSRVSVTELQEAGVVFKRIDDDAHSKLDIDFKVKGVFMIPFKDEAVFMIPLLKLEDHTESFLRNLVAYEQCHHSSDSYIIDYVALLHFLINTPKDVETLVESKIIENWLGNSQDVANVFNGLFKEVTMESSKFYYSDLCQQLETFYNTPYHKKMAMLRHRFSHPWAVFSFLSAMFLLILSLIQALTGVISVTQSGCSNCSSHQG